MSKKRLVLISDTHDLHNQLSVPEGDILVHAGDLTMAGDVYNTQKALNWLNEQPHEHVVFVAGNHDFAFERAYTKERLDFGRLVYLENSGEQIGGINFYGSPVQPWFMDWAFNVHRGLPIRQYWNRIPDGVDVLITHGPPYGILDQATPGKSDHLGCEELRDRMASWDISEPKVHVFGHIHGSHGREIRGATTFVNASAVNEAYKVVNQPIVVEI
jgi:Icc-related predicted phosphoesterase